jgi:hypothetical protein
VTGDEWPQLLDPVDDLPPATIVTQARRSGDKLTISGISHDNGEIVSVTVNGQEAEIVNAGAGVVDWKIEVTAPGDGRIVACAADQAGNTEQTAHEVQVGAD